MTQSLFDLNYQDTVEAFAPLAVRMRPRTLAEFVGQDHVLGAGSWLRNAIDHDALTSIILYGPAGTGKTTLAQVIAHTSQADVVEVSAVSGSVKDLRDAIVQAKKSLIQAGRRTILFVDEIHRFSRSQQDALLHAVEKREVILVGATTENPFFEVNTALNSRSRIIEFKPLDDEAIGKIVQRALTDKRGLKGRFTIEDDALDLIIAYSSGDARLALSTLEAASDVAELGQGESADHNACHQEYSTAGRSENDCKAADASCVTTVAAQSEAVCTDYAVTQDKPGHDTDKHPFSANEQDVDAPLTDSHKSAARDGNLCKDQDICPIPITVADVQTATPQRNLAYDKHGDMHYDIISAFIKSMRGSDPDAAVYWLARMIEGGEDPKFIARRIFILASEDIGNADPQAISVASAAFHAASVIGYPECRINLAQAAVYMALAPKSNASYMAINNAMKDVRSHKERPVPEHLRDRHRPGAAHYGSYHYPHDYAAGHVCQQYLPDGLSSGCFYQPTSRGWEGYRIERTQEARGDIEESGE